MFTKLQQGEEAKMPGDKTAYSEFNSRVTAGKGS